MKKIYDIIKALALLSALAITISTFVSCDSGYYQEGAEAANYAKSFGNHTKKYAKYAKKYADKIIGNTELSAASYHAESANSKAYNANENIKQVIYFVKETKRLYNLASRSNRLSERLYDRKLKGHFVEKTEEYERYTAEAKAIETEAAVSASRNAAVAADYASNACDAYYEAYLEYKNAFMSVYEYVIKYAETNQEAAAKAAEYINSLREAILYTKTTIGFTAFIAEKCAEAAVYPNWEIRTESEKKSSSESAKHAEFLETLVEEDYDIICDLSKIVEEKTGIK